MEPSFHIIEKIHANLKYEVLARDNYGNIIHIPKHFIVNKGLEIVEKKRMIICEDGRELPLEERRIIINVSIEGLEFPFFVLANIKKYKNKEGKKLVGFVIFKKISELINVYTENILLEINGNIVDNGINYHLESIKEITVEYENYIKNKTTEKKHFNFESTLNEIDDTINQSERAYDELQEMEAQRDFDIINEVANQEMRAMDDETEGFWRTENDLG